MEITPEIEVRFWAKVDKSKDCWLWTGCLDRDGYGFIGIDGVPRRTHRVVLLLEGSDVPSGMLVCHHCDNPSCVNPDHLFIGTQSDNIRDMYRKGRNNNVGLKGEMNGSSKLTDAEVLAIREEPGKVRDIAKKYGVSKSLISVIKRREGWSHIK